MVSLRQRRSVKCSPREVEISQAVVLLLSVVVFEAHFFWWVEVKGKGNLLAEISKHFLARGRAEGGNGGDVRFAMVTMSNGAIRANLNNALDTTVDDVKVALFQLGFVFHNAKNRGEREDCKRFFVRF